MKRKTTPAKAVRKSSSFINNKKAQEELGFNTIIELVAVAVLIIIATFIGFKIYMVFFGPDQISYNTYKVMQSNIKILTNDPINDDELRQIFTFECNGILRWWEDAATSNDKEKDFKGFKGTIFLVSSNGKISFPFPGFSRYLSFDNKWVYADSTGLSLTNKNVLPFQEVSYPSSTLKYVYVPRDKLPSECRKDACICFSKDDLVGDTISNQELVSIVTDPYKCTKIEVPKGFSKLEFSFYLEENVKDPVPGTKPKKIFLDQKQEASDGGQLQKKLFETTCEFTDDKETFLDLIYQTEIKNNDELYVYYSLVKI